jgi:alpha-tubulin suppressor-like RCC1 family protein
VLGGHKDSNSGRGIDDTIAVATTTLSSCALKRDHTVWCWGDNTVGQLGNGTTTNSTTPVQVVGITNATAITGGESHMCALLDSGSVRCWGRESLGQLGRGRNYQNTPAAELYSSVPVAVVGLAPIRQP